MLYDPSLRLLRASQVALVFRNPPANAGHTGDTGSIPGRGARLQEEMATQSQYSCLENSTDRGACLTPSSLYLLLLPIVKPLPSYEKPLVIQNISESAAFVLYALPCLFCQVPHVSEPDVICNYFLPFSLLSLFSRCFPLLCKTFQLH